MIAVVDYGMGNLRSVQKALEKVGLLPRVTRSPREIEDARGLVLPGVGAFRDCMNNLEQLGLLEPIVKSIEGGKPFLGICLGLQILFSESEEFGPARGLGLIPGRVVRFPSGMKEPGSEPGQSRFLKIPHMGWNQVHIKKEHPLLRGIKDGEFFYFVHSYYAVPEDREVAATTTDYGLEFVSSVARDNIFACQFHPEKSQKAGLKILENFKDFVNEH